MGTRNFVIATHPPAFFSFFFSRHSARACPTTACKACCNRAIRAVWVQPLVDVGRLACLCWGARRRRATWCEQGGGRKAGDAGLLEACGAARLREVHKRGAARERERRERLVSRSVQNLFSPLAPWSIIHFPA